MKTVPIILMPWFLLCWFGYFLFLLYSAFEKVSHGLDPAFKANAVGCHLTVLSYRTILMSSASMTMSVHRDVH